MRENLRHSLVDVFSDDGIFKPRDYLPATAEWAKFFDWVVLIATAGTHHRLRTYWFVVQELDFFPYGLSQPNRGTNEKLKRVLLRHRPFRERLRALSGTELLREMEEMLGQLREGQRGIESQFRRWITVQNGIAITHRAVEFRRAVINVSFERRNGDLLPGGARRLNIATDASIRIPYVRLREFMGLDSTRAALNDNSTIIATEAVS